ncbi:unnamed protein product [Plutella xylostella]|uniref:(diamondback moth) hypothetical protein n=1 Tax=Plutella xylostella TaxID=51655 RepID=A0A8S4FVH4_PLUXY|nr:unnamed protein product [Plutella xylostella]
MRLGGPSPAVGSCESVDTVGRREMYVKSAFDSMSGTADCTTPAGTKSSLSSQHLSVGRPSPRPRDPEAVRRRDELNRRILETRRQLETVALRSNLKSSQSTTDLSYIPEKDQNSRTPRNRPVSMAIPSNSRPYGHNYNLPEEPLDSLNSNYFDSLNPNINLDYRNKNPYAIPANLNHKILPEYTENYSPYVPPHANIGTSHSDKRAMNYMQYGAKPMVFKEQQLPVKQNLAFTIDLGKPKQVQSKVFDRLFPTKDETKDPPKIPTRNFHLNLNKPEEVKPQKPTKPNARSIFKNYKSCPVSPVSEECKWGDKVAQNSKNADGSTNQSRTNSLDPKKRNSLSFFIGLDGKSLKDNGKSIVDSIKTDTEKMIAEITRKYGDLDEFEPRENELDLQPSKEVYLDREDGNFSSDSLEDCSLSQDASCKNKLYSKKVCKKHSKNNKGLPRRAFSNYEISGTLDKPVVPVKPSYIANQKSSTLPRNMPSNLDDIVDEDCNMNPYSNMYRCQSVLTKRCVTRSNESVLSDNSNCSSVSNEIFLKYGNEGGFQQARFDSRYNINTSQNCSIENLNEADEKYLEKHRHSSASFFLNQKKYMKNSCSQESILSDEFLDNENALSRTNCNSLESVLSDDSECTKSAPLEMLFEGAKVKHHHSDKKGVGIPRNSKSCYEFDNASKSYGSSPNNPPFFGGYMYNNYLGEASSPQYLTQPKPTNVMSKPPINKVCGFEVPVSQFSGHKTVTRSKSLYDSATKHQPPPAKNIAYYFDGSNVQPFTKDNKLDDEIPRLNKGDYMANKTKSLQPKFSEQQKYKSEMDGCETKTMVKSKSCSFEVVLEPASKPNPIKNLMEKRNSHVQKNLEKFEEQIRKNTQTKCSKNQHNKEKSNGNKYNNVTKSLERGSAQKNNNNKVTMEFVPHKPPKPIKRTSSVKLNNRLKAGADKSGLNSTISSHYKAKLDGLHNKNFLSNKKEDNNSNKVDNDDTEKTFDVFVKEKDVNENKSEMQMDSLEVFAMQRMERMKEVSMDSLDVLDDRNDFAKDSLDYYAEQDNKYSYMKTKKEHINALKKNEDKPCHSKDNLDDTESDEIKKYKYIERKLEIINKLVEMEERKMLQEKFLKEWRMRPLKANIDDGKGVVKVLSKKFEKLAVKHSSVPPNYAALTLEDADTDTENSEAKEIKRNLSLPDILDSEQIGGLFTNSDIQEPDNDAGNPNTLEDTEISTSPNEEVLNYDEPKLNNTILNETHTSPPKKLQCRVYNEMVIPKTDVHLDSENYESSTTSSSCTNSPKRLSFYGFHRPKIPFGRKSLVRVPTPRLCMENRMFASSSKVRPVVSSGGAVRSSLFGLGGQLAKKVPIQCPLPSKYSPLSGANQGMIRNKSMLSSPLSFAKRNL